jgi:hypothetical protein
MDGKMSRMSWQSGQMTCQTRQAQRRLDDVERSFNHENHEVTYAIV